ncbi:phosphatase PAP2 family protein [Sphingomonas nostoxanthinifaciens]|uniref:phosphatase PAP2 family protein n=1 Tax=Sphingomonas nostoxanthinifaciens TaxID=2872652 RepID=UPI001CC1F76F|nr:phosphatase PAP2 family protein [Sphingomonas nostoxanthinifaciens]UAK26369.1 phosphatase PAP2 family protein [Sphingomonas nostoxanthinifaciens]
MSRAAPWVALAGFALMLALVLAGMTQGADRAILWALRRPGQPSAANLPIWMVDAAKAFTWLGIGWVRALLALVAAGLLALRGRRRTALMLPVAWAIGAVAVELVKHLVARPRPPAAFHLIAVNQWSFPSGHATGAMALYPLIGLVFDGRRGATLGVVLALLIGLTRIVLGVHWASDVIGGWLLGGTVALAAAAHLASNAQRNVSERGAAT